MKIPKPFFGGWGGSLIPWCKLPDTKFGLKADVTTLAVLTALVARGPTEVISAAPPKTRRAGISRPRA